MRQTGNRVGVTSISRHGPMTHRGLVAPLAVEPSENTLGHLRLATRSAPDELSGTGLVIPVTAGTGTGPTPIAAFDAALLACGIGNYNLIRLSSVVPPLSVIALASGPVAPPGQWGDRLYVVYARRGASQPGSSAWAGIGWIQDPDTGAGLFVEHDSDNEATVRADIALSLEAMAKSRSVDFGPPGIVTAGIRCIDRPVAAIATAVFAASGWDHPGLETARLD